MIIGICGFIGSGKDTVADYLVNLHHFRRESFANTLKDAVSAVFGWDRTMLEGRTKQAREWREQVDLWWAERLNMPNLTPRWILQNWGTEVCRKNFHDDIWIASLENKLRNSTDVQRSRESQSWPKRQFKLGVEWSTTRTAGHSCIRNSLGGHPV